MSLTSKDKGILNYLEAGVSFILFVTAVNM
jgi:hypothetical protein